MSSRAAVRSPQRYTMYGAGQAATDGATTDRATTDRATTDEAAADEAAADEAAADEASAAEPRRASTTELRPERANPATTTTGTGPSSTSGTAGARAAIGGLSSPEVMNRPFLASPLASPSGEPAVPCRGGRGALPAPAAVPLAQQRHAT